MRIEGGNEIRRLEVAALCALMLLLFACAFVLPFLRHFYELATPTGEAAIAWAVGSVLGIAGCWAPSGCSVAHRRFTESKPRHRPAGDVTGRLSS